MSENSIPEGFKMTEFGHLPKVWEVVRFGDKGQFQYGYTTAATEEDTGTKFLRITDIKEDGTVNWGTVPYGSIDDNNLQKFRLSKSDILFARIGATTGKTCIIGGVIPNAVFASYLIRFVPNKELHPKYVFYFTQTREYQELVNAGKEGKLKKGLSATELKNFNIPLPPLPEQRTIAKVLSTVQQAKEKTDIFISATKELKKSLMKHLFTYGPVSVKKFNEFNELRVNELGVNELQNAQNSKNSKNSSNSSNSKNSIKLKETEIGLVPEAWDVVRLGDVCKTKTGGTPSRQNPSYYNGDIPWVKSGELKDNTINYTDEKIAELGLKNSSAKLFPAGTLLIALYGATVGKTGILNIKASTNQAICAIFTYETFLSTKFLRYYFVSARKKLLEERYGGAQPNISQTVIRNAKIPLPPISIQQKIASILSAVDKKIEVEQTKKKSLDELFKSLLLNLMTGKLRVNELQSNRVVELMSL